MFILSMSGTILASFDKWDVKSVQYAEAWIRHHRFYIWKIETLNGDTFVTVRSY